MLEDLFGIKAPSGGQNSTTKGIEPHPRNISHSPDHKFNVHSRCQTPSTSSHSSCCSSPGHAHVCRHATLPATISSLYSSDSGIPQPTFKVSDKMHCFRLVVLQDAGIRKKQTLFDSALGITGAAQNRPNSPMYQKLNKSLYHSINELSTYMFGYYGILMSEAYGVTKMHYLPGLPSMPHSILVTRMFSLDSTFETTIPHNDHAASDWDPTPCENSADYPSNANNSTRFGIGFVIPAGNDFRSVEEEITDNWKEISHHIILVQKAIIKLLKKNYKPQPNRNHRTSKIAVYGYNSCPTVAAGNTLMTSRLSAFPSYFLQSNFELNHQFHSLVRCIQHLVDVPRLLIDLKESDQELIEWSSTVASWLELKDGSFTASDFPWPFEDRTSGLTSRSHLKFLASLIAVLLPERDSIFRTAASRKMKKSCRVVIVTGNPMVSEKLIFIIAGILGYQRYILHSKDMPTESTESNKAVRPSSGSSSSSSSISEKTTHHIPVPSERKVGLPEPKTGLSVSFTHDKVMPISICSKASLSGISSESSTPSESSSVGSGIIIGKSFQPPSRVLPLISNSPTVNALSTVTAKRISIPRLRRESSYASLQNISSSYGGPHQSTYGSSSSWRSALNFGSFMEHWKLGGTKSRTTSVTSSPSRPEFPLGNDRTPSPMAEYNEFPWRSNVPGTPLSRTHTGNNSSSSSPHSSGLLFERPKFKGSSVFNKSLYPYDSRHKIHVPRTTTKLTGPSGRQLEFVRKSVSAILSDDLSLEYETVGDRSSVLIVNNPVPADPGASNADVISNKDAKLPPLVGYIDRYAPEFTLMSCPQTPNVNNSITESMYDDVYQIGHGSQSHTYVVNLREREIKRITVRYPTISDNSPKLEQGSEISSPSKLSQNLKKSQPVSRLTDVLQKSVLRPEVSILFSPLSQGGKRGYEDGSSADTYADSSTSPFINHIDHVLNEISQIVNGFRFTESRERAPSKSQSVSTFETAKGCAQQTTTTKEACCQDLRRLLGSITSW